MKLRYLVGVPVAVIFLAVGLTASLSVFLLGITTAPCDWHTCLVRPGETGRMLVIAGGPFMGYDPFLTGLLGGTTLTLIGIFTLRIVFTEQLKPITHSLHRAIETFNQTATKTW